MRLQLSGEEFRATTDMSGTFTLPTPLVGEAGVLVNDEPVAAGLFLTGANYVGDVFVNPGTCVARYGRVIDSRTLQPVFGATVRLLSVSVATDINGWYQIDLGCPASGGIGFNTTLLTVTHPQYFPVQRIVGRGVFGVERLDVRLSSP